MEFKKDGFNRILVHDLLKGFSETGYHPHGPGLQGRASGVMVENTGGAPGSDVKIRIRGATSMLGDNNLCMW